ncbi:thiamine diphosphokinase [Alkalicoccus saliphilus]|uniref:Thiamine diphosphokinase n=1 Tax=Alkalicoccus saliphilus TaxID=200989 RepID=A0A2T4U8E4_9BACI|nr:thiamine diphosphokinase [Alkalicoccus saliphilus]PTL39666.1 thiamine diphosphokinase [Alkalicoccus saliphilus]
MKYIIYGGGPAALIPATEDIIERHGRHVRWIGVDRGAFTLAESGISMEKAVGDFDSVSRREWETIKTAVQLPEIYPPEKNETDLELAVDFAEKQKPEQIVIVGGTGGRMDHFLSAVHLMEMSRSYLTIEDKVNRMCSLEAGLHCVSRSSFPYVSFLPATDTVEGLTLKGFRYDLSNRKLTKKSTLCISNEWNYTEAEVSFRTGRLLMVESRDMY